MRLWLSKAAVLTPLLAIPFSNLAAQGESKSPDPGVGASIQTEAPSASLEQHFARDEYEAVIADAQASLAVIPESYPALRLMAFALLRKGRLMSAAQTFESTLAVDPDRPSLDIRAALADLDLRAGQREAAASRAKEILHRYSTQVTQLTANDIDGAARAAQVLARDDPDFFQTALSIYETGIERFPEAHRLKTAMGDLLLRKYNSAEARALYLQALEADAEDPESLLALARGESFDESPEAIKLARLAVDRRPGWAAARRVLARAYLNNHEFDQAAEQIEAALAVDPSSSEARGLEAALAMLEADDDRMEKSIEQAIQDGPGEVTVYEVLAEIAVRNRLYPYAVEFSRRAVSADPKAWRSYGMLGMNQLRIGAMRAGRRNLERAFSGDPFNVWVKNTLDLMDRMEQFETFSSEHFVLVADPKEGRVLAPFLLPVAERAFDYYAERYGYSPPTPIRIEIFERHEDFSVRTIGLVGVDILGASFGPVIAMDSPSTRAFGPINWASVIWHEISHSFHLSMSRFRVPRWFTEGLAVLEEHKARPGWGGDVNPGFLIAFRREELPTASQLEAAFQRPATSEQVSHYYYLSYLLTEFIERQYGVEAIVRMLEGYAEGRSVNEMVGAVTGLYGAGLDGALNRHIQLRFGSSIDALTPLVNLDAISTEEAANPYEVTFKTAVAALASGQLEAAEAAFTKAIELFPEHAGPDSAYHQLAKLYRESGRPAKVREMLEAIVAINADDLDAQRELTDIILSEGEPDESIAALQKLELIEPFDSERHRQAAKLYEQREQWLYATRARAAVLDLDPVDRAGAHYELARALTRAGHPDRGREHVLRSLEIAPLFDDGLELLLEIREQLAR